MRYQCGVIDGQHWTLLRHATENTKQKSRRLLTFTAVTTPRVATSVSAACNFRPISSLWSKGYPIGAQLSR